MKNNNITILVNSCDLYEDAWKPFFELLKIQWSTCKCDIVLNTETKEYKCDFLNVKTICTGYCDWSMRLKKALEQIDTELVLFMLEDFFLMSPVDNERFEKAVLIMSDKKIGAVNFDPDYKKVKTYEQIKRHYDNDFDYLQILNAQCCLWKKSFLMNLINERESAWAFEDEGNLRVKYYREKILFRNVNSSPIFDYHAYLTYGYGISRRTWLPNNKSLFEKYGISVNFENLGWYEKPKKQTRNKRTKFELLRLLFTNPSEIINIVKTKLENSLEFRKIKALAFATRHLYK